MSRNLLTVDKLTEKVIDEFSWRRKELTLLKNKIKPEKDSFQRAMIRAVLPLLYAHWEGFVKVSLSCYLEFVSRKRLKHSELKSQFIALSLQKKIGDLKVTNIENKTQIIDFIFSNAEKQSNIPTKNIINTKSNLNYDVFEQALFILDLKDEHFERHKDLINDLVDERNYIAHGEHKLIEYETFIEFYKDIISLMEYLKTQIENSALLESYRTVAQQS